MGRADEAATCDRGSQRNQRHGSVRAGDPLRMATMVLLIAQSTVQSERIVRPILDADALDTELAHALNGYLS